MIQVVDGLVSVRFKLLQALIMQVIQLSGDVLNSRHDLRIGAIEIMECSVEL